MPQSSLLAENGSFSQVELREVRFSEHSSKAKSSESLPGSSSRWGLRIDTLAQTDILPTAMDELNQLLGGGIPRGKLTEINGAVSSGKTGLLFSILTQVTGAGEIVAYVDPFDALDPECARNAGIDLASLLWVRCRGNLNHAAKCLGKALKAADVLVQGGGFGAVVLDMEPFPLGNEARAVRVPPHSWFRLQRAVKGTHTILLILSRSKSAGSAASLTLAIERNQIVWAPKAYRNSNVSCRIVRSERAPQFAFHQGSNSTRRNTAYFPRGDCTHSELRVKSQFKGIESSACLLRGSAHGAVTVHCHFQP